MIEIRWHGRGGQGAKTAALLFGDIVLGTGKYVQAFPEYGPERMGAPVQAFNRIDDKPIRLHCGITEPDYVVVLDESLCEKTPVSSGLKPSGKILINTTRTPETFARMLNISLNQIITIDATEIARKTIGRPIPNTPMLGAIIATLGNIPIDAALKELEKKLEVKFRNRPEVIAGNILSVKTAYQQIINGDKK